MKNLIHLCMSVSVFVCATTMLFAQSERDTLEMRIFETNSTDEQFCFYVHANIVEPTLIGKVDSIKFYIDANPENNMPESSVTTECFDNDICRSTICYDRPTDAVETVINCKAAGSTFSAIDGCTVVIFPLGHRDQEPVELNIIADCGFGTPCNTANLNPNDITHLTVGVPQDDGGFDYIAY